MEKIKISNTVDKEDYTRLKIQAAKEGRTISDILCELIARYLAEKE